MWSVICNWMAENYPSVFLVLSIIAVVAIAVWVSAKFYYQRFVPLEKKVDGMPCQIRQSQYDQIKDDLNQIKTFLMVKNPKTATIFSVKNSPRQLNVSGERLYAEINGDAFLKQHEAWLLNAIEQKKPKTALDAEVAAQDVLIESLELDAFNELKKWVYNSPTRKINIDGNQVDYNITMGDICFVLSIPLRDKYLSVHTEIQ